MKTKTIWLTLLGCTALSVAYLLAFYPGNPMRRLGYALFVSVTPALIALVWATRKHKAWTVWRTAGIYFLLFLATMIVQGYGRMIPVYQIVQRLKL